MGKACSSRAASGAPAILILAFPIRVLRIGQAGEMSGRARICTVAPDMG